VRQLETPDRLRGRMTSIVYSPSSAGPMGRRDRRSGRRGQLVRGTVLGDHRGLGCHSPPAMWRPRRRSCGTAIALRPWTR
jgi:hypothetical protein